MPSMMITSATVENDDEEEEEEGKRHRGRLLLRSTGPQQVVVVVVVVVLLGYSSIQYSAPESTGAPATTGVTTKVADFDDRTKKLEAAAEAT